MKNIIVSALFLLNFLTAIGQVNITGPATNNSGRIPFYTGNAVIGETNLYYNPALQSYGFGTTNPAAKYDFNSVAGDKLKFATLYFSNPLTTANGFIRASIGSNLYWNEDEQFWYNPTCGYNDFASIKFLNQGTIAFYTELGNGNSARTWSMANMNAKIRFKIAGNGNVGVGGFNGFDPTTVLDVKPRADVDGIKLRKFSATGRSILMLADESGAIQWNVGMNTASSTELAFADGVKNVVLMKRQGDLFFDPVGKSYFNTGVTNAPTQAKFNFKQTEILGSNVNDRVKLFAKFAPGGSLGNNVYINEYFVRNEAGSDWQSVSVHNGIGVDASFDNPQSATNGTRTWWERNPENNIQSWGDQNNTYLTINAGKVGIGTKTPGQLLSVNGTIEAKEVLVRLASSSWPDFVFADDYKLKSLEETEQFISENNHLPGIPSAAEIETNGVGVGEMQANLLRKVEELTLHIIAQEKRIKELESKK